MNGRSDFPLRDSESTVLLYILEHGPAHGYRIYKESNLRDKTIYVSLKSLTEKGLLEKKPAEEKHRPGQPMKVYSLTLLGLCVALSISDESWKNIDEIVERWKGLHPFVFKKWQLFKEKRLGVEAKEALKWGMEILSMDWRYRHKWTDGGNRSIEQRFIESMENPKYPTEVKVRWNKVLYEDEELGKKVEDYRKLQLSSNQAIMKQLIIKVKISEMLKEPEPDWKKIEKLLEMA